MDHSHDKVRGEPKSGVEDDCRWENGRQAVPTRRNKVDKVAIWPQPGGGLTFATKVRILAIWGNQRLAEKGPTSWRRADASH